MECPKKMARLIKTAIKQPSKKRLEKKPEKRKLPKWAKKGKPQEIE
jgi:hypothetical protein